MRWLQLLTVGIAVTAGASATEATPPDVAPAVEVLRRLVDRARESSLRGYRHAARTGTGSPPL